ncbi:YwmB family TATA-box binding protein [Niallia oryzisoli]|uniref:YwmB family TATA-box binding protein n=1 Tax=Niallia oryzisoli TaxID=1737571 RepID=UPI0037366238
MKSIKIFLLFLMLLGFYTNSKVNSQTNDNELLELIEIAQKEKINIDSWKIYLTKTVIDVNSEKDIQKEIEKIKRNEEGYKWDIMHDEKEEHHYIVVGNKQVESKHIEIQVKISAFLVGNKYRLYHFYEIKGGNWSKDIWKYINTKFNKEMNENDVFYTLTGTMKGNLELRQQGDQLLSEFSGTFVEGLMEDNFISLSAYTNLLESNTLMVNDKKINLQIGLRKNQKSNLIDVTIGNPIITTEY